MKSTREDPTTGYWGSDRRETDLLKIDDGSTLRDALREH